MAISNMAFLDIINNLIMNKKNNSINLDLYSSLLIAINRVIS